MISKHESETLSVNRLPDIIFWITAVFMLFWALGARSLWTAEGRWAEIAREMLATGRFLHPTINGVPYFDKPLIPYWWIALTSFLTGMNEWALRIPSALCGLATLWATRKLGSRLWSISTGRLAGWILLTANSFIFWARTGQADMANMAFIMLAVLWYWHRREKPCFLTYLLFYVILFTGAQMKGLTAFIVPVLVIIPDLFRGQRWKNLFSLSHFAALFAGAAIYLIPFIYSYMTRDGSYQTSGLDLVFRENLQRFFNPFDHIEPVYIYLKHVPVLFLPWTPVLVTGLAAAAVTARQRGKIEWPDMWLGLALALIFLFFTASGSRRSYYILPIAPFCAMFSAKLLLCGKKRARVAIAVQSGIVTTALVLLWLGTIGLFFFADKLPVELPNTMTWVMAATAAVTTLIWFTPDKQGIEERFAGLPRRTAKLVFTTAVLLGSWYCFILPILETTRTEKPFALELKETGRDSSQIAFYNNYLENTIFYLDMCPPYHPVISSSEKAYEFLKSDRGRVILLRRQELEQMLEQFPDNQKEHMVCEEKIHPGTSERKAGKKITAWSLD